MSDFDIRNFTAIPNPSANKAGNTLYAYFDLNARGISMKTIALCEKPDGRLFLAMPNGETHTGHKINISIADLDLRAEVTQRAANMVTACTGREMA